MDGLPIVVREREDARDVPGAIKKRAATLPVGESRGRTVMKRPLPGRERPFCRVLRSAERRPHLAATVRFFA
jgi:hypothetical protein